MVKLAVNASEALFSLIDNGCASVDYIKVPLSNYPGNRKTIEEASTRSPLLLHPTQKYVLDLASWEPSEAIGTDALSDLLNLTQTVSLSAHIAVKPGCLPHCAQDWTGPQLRQEIMSNLLKNVRILKDVLNVYRENTPLLLENHPAAAWENSISITTEPEFLNEITDRADCEILLDISHARVSAWFSGDDIYTYIRRYDLSRVKELHIAGPRVYDGQGMTDSHESLTETDYGILAWVLEHTEPRILTLEYGGMADTEVTLNGVTIYTERNSSESLNHQLFELRKLIG